MGSQRQSQYESTLSRFFVPVSEPEDWKLLLAKPDRHWKTGYSAKAFAYCWQNANGFPESVRNVFKKSEIELFQDAEFLIAFHEHKVPLPGGRRPSQSDIWALAMGGDGSWWTDLNYSGGQSVRIF
jgi:hypothetical protein